MFVKFLCSVQTDKTTKYIAGSTHEVTAELGEKLVSKGLAERIDVKTSASAVLSSGGTDDDTTAAELKAMTVAQLTALCEGRGIDVPNGANKTLLISLLNK